MTGTPDRRAPRASPVYGTLLTRFERLKVAADRPLMERAKSLFAELEKIHDRTERAAMFDSLSAALAEHSPDAKERTPEGQQDLFTRGAA